MVYSRFAKTKLSASELEGGVEGVHSDVRQTPAWSEDIGKPRNIEKNVVLISINVF